MKKAKRTSPPVVGGTSLFMIFAVLCLTVFTLLTISTAVSDRKLSDVSANAVASYYAADLEAETILASIRRGDIPECVTVENGVYSYSVAVSDTQSLNVSVAFENGTWSVLRWQTATSNQ